MHVPALKPKPFGKDEKLKQIADEFDGIHDIRRAMRVGSVDRIIAAGQLRPFIIGALERRLATGSGSVAS